MIKLVEESIKRGQPVDTMLEDIYQEYGSWYKVAHYFDVSYPTVYKWRDRYVTPRTKIAQEPDK